LATIDEEALGLAGTANATLEVACLALVCLFLTGVAPGRSEVKRMSDIDDRIKTRGLLSKMISLSVLIGGRARFPRVLCKQ
jgi:hypothetical protein